MGRDGGEGKILREKSGEFLTPINTIGTELRSAVGEQITKKRRGAETKETTESVTK